MNATEAPADIKLTRREKQLLKHIQANPGVEVWQAARAIGQRPWYTLASAECVERLRWIRIDPRTPSQSDYLRKCYPR